MSFRPIAPVPHGFSNINDYYKHTVEKTLKGEHCLDRPKCLGYLQFVIKKSPQSKLKQYLTAICIICGKKQVHGVLFVLQKEKEICLEPTSHIQDQKRYSITFKKSQ